MKKVLKLCGWALLGLFVIYTFFFLWKQSRPAPEIYDVEKVQKADIRKKTTAAGALESRTMVELKPQITGIVEKLNVQAGDKVKPGDVVAIIKVIPDMAQLNQAQSQVEASRIALDEARREAERSAKLYGKGVISREEYEKLQNACDAANDRLQSALAQVEVITKGSSARAGRVNTTEVRSTMNGVVLSVPVKVGTSVSGSSAFSQGTTIATVADMEDIIFKGNIDETEVARLHTGMSVLLVPGAMQEVTIPATLDYISPEGKIQNGAKMFELKATADVPDGMEVRSGYSVNASIVIDEAKQVLSVGEGCIEFSGDSTFAYRLVSDPADIDHQKFEKVPVSVGISDGMKVEIKSGLEEGALVRGARK